MPVARDCGVGLSAVQLTARPCAAKAWAVVGPIATNCRWKRVGGRREKEREERGEKAAAEWGGESHSQTLTDPIPPGGCCPTSEEHFGAPPYSAQLAAPTVLICLGDWASWGQHSQASKGFWGQQSGVFLESSAEISCPVCSVKGP